MKAEGVVEIRPRSGTLVIREPAVSIAEMAMIRAALEGIASRLAAKKVSDEQVSALGRQMQLLQDLTDRRTSVVQLIEASKAFHWMIFDYAGNTYVSRLIRVMRSFDSDLRNNALSDEEFARMSCRHHREIFDAIARRDPDAAQKATEDHIRLTVEYLSSEKYKSKATRRRRSAGAKGGG